MRIAIIFLLIFLSASGCIYAASGGEEKKTAAEDEQGPYFWDFGQVPQGEVLEHAFVLENDSSTVMRILSLHTSCGCTTSEIEKKEIPPGESTEIRVKFKTRGYLGIKKQFVHIRTDRKQDPFIKLILKAEIQKKSSGNN